MNPPANWYPDPTGRHGQRYWDGEQWTEHVFTEGVQDVDPLDAAGADSQQDGSSEGSAVEVDEVTAAADAARDDAVAEEAGLFADAGEAPAEQAVAPEGGSADADPADSADSTDSVEDETTPADDFSDAFMVTPETVSRLVSRQASAAPQAAEETPEEAQPASTSQSELDDAPADAADAAAWRGITGDLVGGAFAERTQAGPAVLQNSRLLRCSLHNGSSVIARQGTMVAYRGQMTFEPEGAALGGGPAMMRADGTGDVFFADGAQDVFLLQLEDGAGLSVNGRNVLAFSADLQWDTERVEGATLLAGGLFNTALSGTGWVALVSDGEPVVLRTEEAPTHVDVNALVAWSGGLTTRISNSVDATSVTGLGAGEAFQMVFDGAGIVVVQPSEGPTGGASAT